MNHWVVAGVIVIIGVAASHAASMSTHPQQENFRFDPASYQRFRPLQSKAEAQRRAAPTVNFVAQGSATRNDRSLMFAAMLRQNDHAKSLADGQFLLASGSLLGPSTSRDPVDIEIIGSIERGANNRQLQPERLLRLRLERAFITNYLTEDPGFSIVSISINRSTGLPNALFIAALEKGRFHRDLPDAPKLTREELSRQHIGITIQSKDSDTSFSEYFRGAEQCVGQAAGDDLWEMVLGSTIRLSACTHSFDPSARRWLARQSDGSPLVIECKWESSCSTRFPFERFSVQVRFHQSALHQWKDVISFARKFLISKQVSL